jgi:hypothetical protein
MAHVFKSLGTAIRSSATATTFKVLPVNNSAPPAITRTRPSEKTTPASTRVAPYGISSSAPAAATVANIPPNPM